MKKIDSLTIFFPFFNDAGTVARQIDQAFLTAKKVSVQYEIIALHGGNSRDDTFQEINRMKSKYPKLKIINKLRNRDGYAVIKNGFKAATQKWVFYTDGDAQYHLEIDLPRLIEHQKKTGVDVVNGYKEKRQDNRLRVVFGKIYSLLSRVFFELPIRDVDCDFRLIRMSFLKKIKLLSRDSSILPELIVKLKSEGAIFSEVPVSHFSRAYGKSNYTTMALIKEKIIGDMILYFRLRNWRRFLRKRR